MPPIQRPALTIYWHPLFDKKFSAVHQHIISQRNTGASNNTDDKIIQLLPDAGFHAAQHRRLSRPAMLTGCQHNSTAA